MAVVPISMQFVPYLGSPLLFNTIISILFLPAWRHLWKWAVAHLCSIKNDVKKRRENVTTPWYQKKLETLAIDLWENRYLLFFAPSE